MMDKDKCPYCGAETRPGDNFCLNCGNRLSATSSSAPQQAQPAGDATITAPGEWGGGTAEAPPASSDGWADEAGATIAEPNSDHPYAPEPLAQPHNNSIEQPARFILRAENGDILQEYPLDKAEITIGRAPNSDILLSKDKLTSRRHATVHFENGHYTVRDERSANGTFVNAQQIEELLPVELHDNDHVGIGEHELVFHVFGSVVHHSVVSNVEDLPTIAVPYEPATFRTQDDDQRTVASTNDDYGTSAMEVEQEANPQPEVVAPSNGFTPEEAYVPQPVQSAPDVAIPAPVSYATPTVAATSAPAASSPAPSYAFAGIPATSSSNNSYAGENAPMPTPAPVSTPAPIIPSVGGDTDVTFNRLSKLSPPALPDITDLTAALSTLDGQVMSLQQQLNATQDALHTHEAEINRTADQLRGGVRKVTERMDNTIADVARTREALAWSELLQLMEDVMNNPRDIEYVTKLARKARELNKVFQLHQSVLNTMAECNSLLRSMISEDNK